MFQFPSFASHLSGITQLHCAGFPHSDILGSKVICTSPKLFAAYHVLHRLPEPRHPPFALNLLFSIFIFARLFYLIVLAQPFQSAMYTLSYRIASTTLLFSFFQYVKERIHLLFIHLLFTISISQWFHKHEQTFNKMLIYSVSKLLNRFVF